MDSVEAARVFITISDFIELASGNSRYILFYACAELRIKTVVCCQDYVFKFNNSTPALNTARRLLPLIARAAAVWIKSVKKKRHKQRQHFQAGRQAVYYAQDLKHTLRLFQVCRLSGVSLRLPEMGISPEGFAGYLFLPRN